MEFATQVRTFFLIMATGLLLGFLFDTYRVLNRRFRPPWLVTALTDLVYCLVAVGIAFAALLAGNWGELRFYVFMALFTGLILYFRLASRYVVHMVTALLVFLGTVFKAAKRLLTLTVIKPVMLVARLLVWPLRLLKRQYTVWYNKWRPPPPSDSPRL